MKKSMITMGGMPYLPPTPEDLAVKESGPEALERGYIGLGTPYDPPAGDPRKEGNTGFTAREGRLHADSSTTRGNHCCAVGTNKLEW